MKELEKVFTDENFVDLDLKGEKEFVLECIKNGLINDLFSAGIKLYDDYSIAQLMRMYYKINPSRDYFKSFNSQMLEIMSSMQAKEIKVVNSSRKAKHDMTVSERLAGTVYRMSKTPIFNYNYEGELANIEVTNNTSQLEIAISLVEFFDKRFLEQKDINRLVRRYK